jgi:hypothetical protein
MVNKRYARIRNMYIVHAEFYFVYTAQMESNLK